MIAMRATASTDTIATSGHVHGLRRVWPAAVSRVRARLASAGVSTRVAVVDPAGVSSWVKAVSPPPRLGTAAMAAATSPRRSACAARERLAAELGRSSGFFAMQA
jgi:hypothetical protein